MEHSVHAFQTFINEDKQLHSFGECLRTVDLLRLNESDGGVVGGAASSRNRMLDARSRSRVALVVDAEDCLDRLYGGFYSDWSCGGQWAHMLEFLATLMGTFQKSNVQLAIHFNGTLSAERQAK